jgi:hypothetical protein
MQPALTADELARRYPHLTFEQRLAMERWHRGRNHDRMMGLPVDETAQPPYPEYPPGSRMDQALQLVKTQHFDAGVVIGLRRLYDEARGTEERFWIGHLIESQIVLAETADDIALLDKYWGHDANPDD